jgi:hypothetical protein
MRLIDGLFVATRYSIERLLIESSCAASSWLTSNLSFGWTVAAARAFFLEAIAIAISIPHHWLRAKIACVLSKVRQVRIPPETISIASR